MYAMFAWLPLFALAIAVAGVLWRVPIDILREYFATFARRHGISVQLGATVLSTMVLGIVVASLIEPGRRPVMEVVDATVMVLGLVAAGIDLYRFSRARRPVR